MSDAQNEVIEETVEGMAAAEEAAMEAQFDGKPPEPVAKPEPEAEPAPDPEPEPEFEDDDKGAKDTLEKANPEIAQLKEELQKLRDTAFGRLGSMQQTIDALRSAGSGISPKAREKMAEEFPELAKLMFDEDGEIKPLQEKKVDVDEIVSKKVTEIERNFEKKLVSRDHPDWVDVVKSDDFAGWGNEHLTETERIEFRDSWDSDLISKRLKQFKDWKKTQAEKESSSEAEKKEAARKAAEEKKKQLAAAVMPKGDKRLPESVIDDEEAAMEAAFNTR